MAPGDRHEIKTPLKRPGGAEKNSSNHAMEKGEYGWTRAEPARTRNASAARDAATTQETTPAARTIRGGRRYGRPPSTAIYAIVPPFIKTSKISIEGDSAPTEQARRQRVVMGTPARGPMAAEEQDETKISSPHHQHPNLKNQADIVGHSRRHPTSIRNPRNEALLSQEEPVVTEMVEEL